MTKANTVVNIYRIKGRHDKKHYKSITIPRGGLTVWKALVHGMMSTCGVDIEKLRAQRKRKGGK